MGKFFNSIVVTCEHAGNFVPAEYQYLFRNTHEVLQTHRGWDPGALTLATFFSSAWNARLFYCLTTRLLVEANRSLDNEQIFSEYTVHLNDREKQVILNQFYFPYRKSVEDLIFRIERPVLHFSVHTFTPVLNEVIRETDIGLLFDPTRMGEYNLCNALRENLQEQLSELQIDFNEPYAGVDDGFTTAMRKQIPGNDYLGIELEVNQKHVRTTMFEKIQSAVSRAVLTVNY